MPHKLLIQVTWNPTHPIRGKRLTTTLEIRNIGEAIFPGGEVTKFMLSYPNYLSMAAEEALSPLPQIPSEEKVETSQVFFPRDHGLSTVSVNIKANDGETVDHYQSRVYNMGTEFKQFIYIRDSTLVGIHELLEEILNQLKKFHF